MSIKLRKINGLTFDPSHPSAGVVDAIMDKYDDPNKMDAHFKKALSSYMQNFNVNQMRERMQTEKLSGIQTVAMERINKIIPFIADAEDKENVETKNTEVVDHETSGIKKGTA